LIWYRGTRIISVSQILNASRGLSYKQKYVSSFKINIGKNLKKRLKTLQRNISKDVKRNTDYICDAKSLIEFVIPYDCKFLSAGV